MNAENGEWNVFLKQDKLIDNFSNKIRYDAIDDDTA